MNNTLFEEYPELVSVSDLMNMLSIGRVLAYRLISDKKVKAVKIGREYKIVKNSVIALIQRS